MPNFPRGKQSGYDRYESKATPTTQQPSAFAPEDNTGEAVQKIGAQTGEAIQAASVKWTNAVDTIQKTTAQANFKSGMLDITTRAANDPNNNNSDQYLKEIEKLKTDNLKGFASKTAETEMALNFGYESKVGQAQIQNIYKKKMIDVGQANSMKLIDMEVNNPTENSLPNIQAELNKQVSAGIFSHEAAYKMYQDSEQKVKFNTFLQDFRSNPVGAEKQFNQNSYGMDIETSEKARAKLNELKVIQKEQEGNLYGDMGLRVVTGQLPEDEINAAIAMNKLNPNEGITEAHGKTLKAALYKDVTKRIGEKEFKKYKQAIDFVFSSSPQDRFKGYEAILAAYTDGLDKDDASFLKKILDTKKDVKFANDAAAGIKFIETLFGARPKNVPRETQSLLLYAKKIANGTSPDQAAQETAFDLIKEDHPAIVGDPELAGAFSPRKGFKNVEKVKSESSSGRQK